MRYLVVAMLCLFSASAYSQDQNLGIGVSLGNPTGLNGKYWLNEGRAVDGGFAISPGLGTSASLSIHSDHLWHKENAFYLNDVHPLDLAFGIGGRMEFGDDIEVGARLPVGLVHKFTEKSADMFAEVAPIFDFMGKTGMELHLLFGARVYFR